MATLGTQMQGVAVGWHVYSLTRDPLDLGYVGLAQFLPAILLWPFTGQVADRFDRARILSVCYCVLALAGIGLALFRKCSRQSSRECTSASPSRRASLVSLPISVKRSRRCTVLPACCWCSAS